MASDATMRAVVWLSIACLFLLSDAASPNNRTCPAGCDCAVEGTLTCGHLYTGTGFPQVDGDDVNSFYFSHCRFVVNISTVPYENAELLSLENCGVSPSIGPRALSRFKRLRSLIVNNNQHLENIDGEAFAGLTALEYVDLASNNLRQLPAGLFAGLAGLKHVDLSFNRQLRNLSASLFGAGSSPSSSSLTTFLCNDCGLNAIPADFLAATPQLTRLELNENNLTTVGGRAFVGLPSLKELALDSNRLTSVDADAFSGLDLNTLRLGHNRIATVESPTISILRKLRTLELDDNMLTSITQGALPSSLFDAGSSPPSVLKLGNNPWNCVCDLQWLRKLDKEKIYDYDDVICSQPTSAQGRQLYGVGVDFFCSGQAVPNSRSSYAVAAIVCSSLGLAALGFGLTYRCCAKRRERASPARYTSGIRYTSPADKA